MRILPKVNLELRSSGKRPPAPQNRAGVPESPKPGWSLASFFLLVMVKFHRPSRLLGLPTARPSDKSGHNSFGLLVLPLFHVAHPDSLPQRRNDTDRPQRGDHSEAVEKKAKKALDVFGTMVVPSPRLETKD